MVIWGQPTPLPHVRFADMPFIVPPPLPNQSNILSDSLIYERCRSVRQSGFSLDLYFPFSFRDMQKLPSMLRKPPAFLRKVDISRACSLFTYQVLYNF